MGTLEILFLGTGDAFGSGGRLQPCLQARTGDFRFLMDCGASALIAMKRFGVDPAEIGLILLSHLHGDHFAGIPFLILDGQFNRRTRPLLIAGPAGVEERVRGAMETLFPGSSGKARKFPVEFAEMKEEEESAFGPLRVTPFPAVHPSGSPAFALRVACAGREIGYSGDTEWSENLVPAARGTDLFISECYSYDKDIPYHLNYRVLREKKPFLGCKRLILTHMGDEMLRQLPSLADAEWAEDGLRIEV
jgi:ribonuclease BN (tRNA processing enzyme)